MFFGQKVLYVRVFEGNAFFETITFNTLTLKTLIFDTLTNYTYDFLIH